MSYYIRNKNNQAFIKSATIKDVTSCKIDAFNTVAWIPTYLESETVPFNNPTEPKFIIERYLNDDFQVVKITVIT